MTIPKISLIAFSRRSQRGQTVFIALLVLLLLAFVGALFITIVARNLRNAGRGNRVLGADYYAEAGLRFADDQLTHSLAGADWRPTLQFKLGTAFLPPAGRALDRYMSAANTLYTLPTVPEADPDKAFLEQGFVRYTLGQGRYLIRVTYDPVGLGNDENAAAGSSFTAPNARYLKIESVGREGLVDAADPTTYQNAPPTRLATTLVAYKPIGITDYSRFETNPDKRSDVMSLGVPSVYQDNGNNSTSIVTPGVYDFKDSPTALRPFPIITVYGAPDAYTVDAQGNLTPNPTAGTNANPGAGFAAGGGSLHANGSLRFYGLNEMFLNRILDPTDTAKTATARAFDETVEIAGDLQLDGYTPANPIYGAQSSAVLVNPPPTFNPDQPLTPVGTQNYYVYPTGDANFTTKRGAVRDGATGANQNDAQNYPRNVNRLEPPVLDAVNPATNLSRYEEIARKLSARLDPKTGRRYSQSNASEYGYGKAIYVDNTTDVQSENSKRPGGYTLIDQWLNRDAVTAGTTGSKGDWYGDFYNPPGVNITFGAQRDNNTPDNSIRTYRGIRLTRSDEDNDGTAITWRNPDGTTNGTRTTLTVAYRDLYASNDLGTVPTTPGPALDAYNANPNNDVLIYAEGNVRLHGVISADPNAPNGQATSYGEADDKRPRHITIVTNGTAYIDGSLLKGNPESSITVLARDYVCVNTTQFLAGPQLDENQASLNPPTSSGDPSLHALDFSADTSALVQEFIYGIPSGSNAATATAGAQFNGQAFLFVSGGPNATSTQAEFDLVNPLATPDPLSINGGGQPFSNPVYNPIFTSTGAGSAALTRTTFDLTTNTTVGPILNGANNSTPLQLYVRRAPGVNNGVENSDFLLERVAILPNDVRIEAVLYAQNRSFFVIPGPSFNSSSDDNLNNFAQKNNPRPVVNQAITEQARFPFFGQPIDMKIIISGAVSEARPADISAQNAWMQRWGWIPQYHGSLVPGSTFGAENAGHVNALAARPAIGLNLIYDPTAGYPFMPGANAAASHYLRYDPFGRPLPVAPKLPVCTGLLYAGQSNERPILQ